MRRECKAERFNNLHHKMPGALALELKITALQSLYRNLPSY